MNKAKVVAVTVSILFLASCTTETITFRDTYHLSVVKQKFKAKMDEKLIGPTYESDDHGAHGIYQVGRALSYIIENDPKAEVSLSYVASSADYVLTPSFGVRPGAIANDHLTVLVQANGQRQVIEVFGHGDTYWNTFNAYQEAIERAVISLHQKLTALF